MSKSELNLKTVYVCPQCGWIRPDNYHGHNCGKCNSTLIPKTIRADCNTLEREIAMSVYAAPCEKANECSYATDKCYEAIPYFPNMRVVPARRWVDCMGWKLTIGLTFVPELGTYMITRCPLCDLDLVKHLKEQKRKL